MSTINENEFKRVIAERIKSLRKDSQENLAEEAELSIDTISSIKRGKSVISSLNLVKICNVLKVTPNDIVTDFIQEDSELDKKIKRELPLLSNEEKKFLISTIDFIKQHKS